MSAFCLLVGHSFSRKKRCKKAIKYLAKANYDLDIFNLLPSFCASILDNDIKTHASFFMPDEKICDYVWSGPNGSELLLRAMLVTVTKTMSDTQMHRSNRQYVHLWI